jgi:hypothetical protein
VSRALLLVASCALACRNEPTGGERANTSARGAPSAPEANGPHAPAVAIAPSASSERDGARAPNGAALASLGEPAGSCDWTNVVSTCFEAVGPSPRARDDAFRALAQVCKSVPQRGPCPRERRVGACRTPDGFVEHYYAAGSRPYTASEARAECESRDGRWLG